MISFTTIIEAGKITEDSEHLVCSQEFNESQAEFLAQALAIATDAPACIRWITIGRTREIWVKPSDIKWTQEEFESLTKSINVAPKDETAG